MKHVVIKDIVIGDGAPKICVPLVGRNEVELEEQLDKILAVRKKDKGIGIVEFRGDFFEGLNDESRLCSILKTFQNKLSDIILLFTIRSETEGGERLSFSSPDVNDINEFVIKNRLADMVDIELMSGDDRVKRLCDMARENGVHIIMSNHDFASTPPREIIVERLEKMKLMGADIAKIAVMPKGVRELLTLLDATLLMKEKQESDFDIPVVTMAMGRIGALSRLTGEIFGSAITFASVEKASAPGQIPYDIMTKTLETVSDFCV